MQVLVGLSHIKDKSDYYNYYYYCYYQQSADDYYRCRQCSMPVRMVRSLCHNLRVCGYVCQGVC